MRAWTSAGSLVAVNLWSHAFGAPAAPAQAAPDPMCAGAYADDMSILKAQARTFDRDPQSAFSYCARNTAIYECLSYAADGSIRRERREAVAHGTAFAYRRQGSDTYLLTNDHVASWPAVTDEQHRIEGIPSGCKKISETLALVDDENDTYARDDIPVARVVTDPQLDVAILKASAPLQVIPWKVGRSAALRERNVVEVHGFPLGAFRATNVGKVISALDHDDYGDWDHDDFVIDALLSAGNSGSPVLAISCATGEYELVGIFHAGYTAGSALNVVVGIDQVREMMTTLKRAPRPHKDDAVSLDATTRADLQRAVGSGHQMFFPFGGAVAAVYATADGRLLFAIFPKEFPLVGEPTFVAEDLPDARPDAATATGAFGALGRVWIGSPSGLAPYERSSMDADAQAQSARLLDAMRADAASTIAFRRATTVTARSREAAQRIQRMRNAMNRTGATRSELLQAAGDLTERLGRAAENATTFAALLTAPPAPPAAPASALPLALSRTPLAPAQPERR
jgi:serine protease Do